MQQQPRSVPPTRAAAAAGQYTAILDALDESSTRGAAGRKAPPRTRAPRIPYRVAQVPMTVEQPGGGTTRMTVTTRNLSASGIGVLCDGYLHAGSTCAVALVTLDRQPMVLTGKAVHCRHVTGRTHEVGIQFREEIDVSRFIASDAPAGPAVVAPAELRGTVFVLDDSPMDLALFKHHTASSAMTVSAFAEAAATLRALRENAPDVFVCDLYLDCGIDGIAVLRQARTAGFEGPFVLVTAEQSVRKHAEALAAGAVCVVQKPYDGPTLLGALRRAHEECGLVVDPRLPVSRLAGQPQYAGQLRAFAIEAGGWGSELLSALGAKDAAAFRRTLLRLKTAAAALGFDALAALSQALLTAPAGPVPQGPARRLAAACHAIHDRDEQQPLTQPATSIAS